MQKLNLIFICAVLLTMTACHTSKNFTVENSQPSQTAQKYSVTETRTLSADYLLFLPKGYGEDLVKRWPLILFLHGAGERGTNIWLVTKHGPPKIATQVSNFPFIVVSPQCPEKEIWHNELLLALLKKIETQYAVDTNRIYLTGISMGGFGTWSLGLSHPELFAAIAPICGGGDYITPYLADQHSLTNLPVWAFHGAKDPVVPPGETIRMVNILKKLGAREVKLTIYPDAQHDCWTRTYANPELFDWFLQHSR